MNIDEANGNIVQMMRKKIVELEMNCVPNLLKSISVVLTKLTTSKIVYDSVMILIVEFQYMLSLI